ncbi:MAG: TonB-dependent receptor plug domain-containing protein [Sphingomonas sp.]
MPFGSAGGTLTIRGFDSSRISLTFDGIPLNDTGNYCDLFETSSSIPS